MRFKARPRHRLLYPASFHSQPWFRDGGNALMSGLDSTGSQRIANIAPLRRRHLSRNKRRAGTTPIPIRRACPSRHPQRPALRSIPRIIVKQLREIVNAIIINADNSHAECINGRIWIPGNRAGPTATWSGPGPPSVFSSVVSISTRKVPGERFYPHDRGRNLSSRTPRWHREQRNWFRDAG